MIIKTTLAFELDAHDLVDALVQSRALIQQVSSEALCIQYRSFLTGKADLFLIIQQPWDPGTIEDGAELVGRIAWQWYDRLGLPDIDFEILSHNGPKRSAELRRGVGAPLASGLINQSQSA